VNGYLRLWLPARCYWPAVAGGIIYADLWGELNTHLVLQALFTQSSPVCQHLLQAFPFPSSLGEVTLHPLSLACVFAYSSRKRWVSPPLLWSFLPSATLTSFPTPGCWAHSPAPAGDSLARPSLFIYSSGKDSPPPLFRAQCTSLSFPCVFIFLIAYYSVSLFSPGGGRSFQGAMLFWPRVACGSTVYHLAHLVRVFPSHLGMGDWLPGGPPGFSV
jgi:hypothetical protein